MSYEICQVRFINNKEGIKELAVLYRTDDGIIKGSICTSTPCSGYKYLKPTEEISQKLILEVVDFGMEISRKKLNKCFNTNI